ncbi:MAG: ankyrin repeat domain-containing protein, partial [Phycisphaerales bacterium]|nr:ankyrin repeat domain-containing protein [Phycisphaerales bacterium]
MRKLHVNGLGALLATLLLWGAAAPEAPVADAAMRGDVDAVRTLLRQGADVNAAQGDGMTALHWAAEHGNQDMASALIYAGANLEAATRLGEYTPLHLAAKSGRTDVVRVLVDAGANVQARTSTGSTTALHFAAAAGDAVSVRLLAEHGADVNARESLWAQTPMMFAASRGRTEAVKALAAAGADLSATSGVIDVVEQAAADRAAGQVREQVLKTFQGDRVAGGEGWLPSPSEVQAAVKAAQQVPQAMVQANMGMAIDVFSNSDSATAAAALVPRGAGDEYDPSYPSLVGEQGGLTALLHAVREGHVSTVFALLDAGADIDQPSAGDHTTPILMAAINGHYDLLLQLLERGAD